MHPPVKFPTPVADPLRHAPISVPFFYGWVIVACAAAAGFLGSGMANLVMSVMLKPMTEDLGWTRSMVAGALSAGGIIGAFATPVTGYVADRYGVRALIPPGAAIVGILFLFISQVSWYPLFLLAYVPGRAVFQSTMSGVVPQTAVANWFWVRRPRAMGIVAMALPLGGAVMAVVAQFLLEYSSWRAVMVTYGVLILLVVVLPSALLLRRRPEDLGMTPDGFSPEQRAAASAARSGAAGRSAVEEYGWTLREAMHTPALWFITFSYATNGFAAASIGVHQVAYYTDRGIPPALAASALSVYALSGAMSNVLWGFLTEHVSARLLNICTLLMSAACIWFLTTVDTAAAAFIFAVAFGVFGRGQVALVNIILAQYYGRRSFGSIAGFSQPFASFAGALGPLAAALTFDATGSYMGVFYVFMGTFVFAALLMFLARRPTPPVGE